MSKVISDTQLALEELVGKAHAAVEYVGVANYPEREQEAHQRVDRAANTFAAHLAELEKRNAELVGLLKEAQYFVAQANFVDSGALKHRITKAVEK